MRKGGECANADVWICVTVKMLIVMKQGVSSKWRKSMQNGGVYELYVMSIERETFIRSFERVHREEH
jgi:hypothetical protein